jgi:hypothetical protein
MFTRNPTQTGLNVQAEILSRGAVLENTFHSLSLRNVPLSAIMIVPSSDPLSSTPPTVDTEILEEAVATSEIFRHCALIYLYRVVRGDKVDLDARTRESLDEVLTFFTLHPPFPTPLHPFPTVVNVTNSVKAFKLLPRVPEYLSPYLETSF